MNLLSQPKKGRGAAAPLKEFGEHPDTGDKIQLLNGKYGPYIKCGKVNASVPEDIPVEAVTREKALELIEARGGMKKKSKGKAAKADKADKKAPVKKTAKAKTKSAKTDDGDDESEEESKPAPKTTAKKVIRRKK